MKKGATVIAVDRNVGNLKKTATLRPYELDITDWTALKKLYCDVLSKHGRIDIVVNNAGLFERTPPLFVTVFYSSADSAHVSPGLRLMNIYSQGRPFLG